MEKNKFYIILGSRCKGRISAQCEYLARAYKKTAPKKQAERDTILKIIKAYTDELITLTDELITLRKTVQNKIQQLKGQSTTTKKESITRWAYMDVLSLLSIQLGSMQDRIEEKVEDIIKDYEKE